MANILIVDDDLDLLHLAQKLLASQQHNVMVAKDALFAIELIGKYQFHLIITDINMPHHSGFDFLKTLRNQKALEKVAIAMLTGRRDKKDIDRALQLGVDDYIIKPIDPILFIKKVERLLTLSEVPTQVEIEVAQTSSWATGKVEFEIRVASISEMGIVLYSPHPLTESKLVSVICPVFTEIGIEPPFLKVLTHFPLKSQQKSFEIRLAFIGLDDASLQKIRAWIFKTQVKVKIGA